MVLVIGFVLIVLASVLHTWYSANAMATPGNAAMAFRDIGAFVLLASIGLFGAGLVCVWIATSIVGALMAAAVYFFILPLVMMPLLERTNWIPDRRARYTREQYQWERKMRSD